jgi:hypothetical protein
LSAGKCNPESRRLLCITRQKFPKSPPLGGQPGMLRIITSKMLFVSILILSAVAWLSSFIWSVHVNSPHWSRLQGMVIETSGGYVWGWCGGIYDDGPFPYDAWHFSGGRFHWGRTDSVFDIFVPYVRSELSWGGRGWHINFPLWIPTFSLLLLAYLRALIRRRLRRRSGFEVLPGDRAKHGQQADAKRRQKPPAP